MVDDAINQESILQWGPFPEALADFLSTFHVFPGWTFRLCDMDRDKDEDGTPIAGGLTLAIYIAPADAYHPDQLRPVVHYRIVPAATYDRRAWRRWVLDQCHDVIVHELCEHFDDNGTRPFAPNHGPGRDPYTILELGTDEDARTSFRGEIKPVAPPNDETIT